MKTKYLWLSLVMNLQTALLSAEDDSSVASSAKTSDHQNIVNNHDYGFISPGRKFGQLLSRVGGGPNVEVLLFQLKTF